VLLPVVIVVSCVLVVKVVTVEVPALEA